MMKWMGLDVGDARIGIAFSDDRGRIAFPRAVYDRVNRKSDERFFQQLIVDEKVEGIVYGEALNMDGSLSEQGEKNQRFIDGLKKRLHYCLDGKLVWIPWDERLSSVQALASLQIQGLNARDSKSHVDAVAASIILQGYLDHVEEKTMKDHTHEHDEHCGCGCGCHEDAEEQRVELIDEDGEVSIFLIDDWFEFEERLYAVLVDENDDDDAVLFRVEEQGEEMEFLMPDEDEFERVSAYYETMDQ